MNEESYDMKSEEAKKSMLIILQQLYLDNMLTETEYHKAVEMVIAGEYTE